MNHSGERPCSVQPLFIQFFGRLSKQDVCNLQVSKAAEGVVRKRADLTGIGKKLGEMAKISPLTVTNPPRIPWKSNLIGDNFSAGGEQCQTGEITHFTKEFNLTLTQTRVLQGSKGNLFIG